MRVLIHVQHLLGIGHDRRAAALSRALVEEGFAVTVARGGHPVHGNAYHGARVVQLPPARAADATFKTLLKADGLPIDDAWRADRTTRLMELFEDTDPAAVIVESFPFARRAFRFELIPLLEAAKARGRLTVASIRDILVAKNDPKRVDEVVDTVNRLVDRVLVHGDERVVPLSATFPAADRIADRIAYTGYVTRNAKPAESVMARSIVENDATDGRDEVIVSVGGGAVGLPLLRAALDARPLTPAADTRWRLLVGPDVAEAAFRDLASDAPDGVIVERARPDFPTLLERCRLSISQAGYNTTLDLLQAGCRSVVVPFAAGGETEQALRAGILSDLGRLSVVDEATLDGNTLAAGVREALAAPDPKPLNLRLDGARESAAALRSWLTRGA